MQIYSISDSYISYLRNDINLKNVYDNKENGRTHTRKYLGIVFQQNGFDYFVPFSSPKPSDYQIKGDITSPIRKSIVPIMRMTIQEPNKNIVLLGTLRISNMIPVPVNELEAYRINDEQDIQYKKLVAKQYAFIKSHNVEIIKNAKIMYSQKISSIDAKNKNALPKYIDETVDFKYAEQKCIAFDSQRH